MCNILVLCTHRETHVATPGTDRSNWSYSPALVKRRTVVMCKRQSATLDLAVCQHLLAKDARHVMQPWYDDSSSSSLVKETTRTTTADLLLKTGTDSVCGLSFLDSVSPNIAQQVTICSTLALPMRLLDLMLLLVCIAALLTSPTGTFMWSPAVEDAHSKPVACRLLKTRHRRLGSLRKMITMLH